MLFTKAPEIDRHEYLAVGRCIYCGSTNNLSDEHIVPYGLDGNLILPKSSCKKCAEITSKFELAVQRGFLQLVRVYRGVQSRSSHENAPKCYPLKIEVNNTIKQISVPITDYPILVPFPVFSPPGYLTGKTETTGISIEGHVNISFGITPYDAMKKYGATRIVIELPGYKPTEFARMIAKIAYSMAVATNAFEDSDYSKSFVLPAILGKKDDIGQWVGTITEPIISPKYNIHRVLIHPDLEKGLLIGDVQIFSDSETPRYGVALSKLE